MPTSKRGVANTTVAAMDGAVRRSPHCVIRIDKACYLPEQTLSYSSRITEFQPSPYLSAHVAQAWVRTTARCTEIMMGDIASVRHQAP